MPTKITVPLDQRVCKRGHVGKYVVRSTATACTQCELEKRKAIQDAVRALTPPKHEIPLNERVCKYGHVGKYIARPKRGTVCKECMKIATAKYKVKADAVKAILYPKPPRLPLDQRPCTYGHVGYYVDYSGNLSCSACRSDQHRRRMELRGARCKTED
jgi:hypothetical protein